MEIKRYSRLSPRVDETDLCDKNDNVLSMPEVVKRWHESGQFMMQEVNHSDAYEGKSADLNNGDIIGRISKIESYLMGIHQVNEMKAQKAAEKAEEGKSEPSAPSEPASE